MSGTSQSQLQPRYAWVIHTTMITQPNQASPLASSQVTLNRKAIAVSTTEAAAQRVILKKAKDICYELGWTWSEPVVSNEGMVVNVWEDFDHTKHAAKVEAWRAPVKGNFQKKGDKGK